MTAGLVPGLLIAAPQLLDVNFARTVILLLHHDETGSMGVVINRQLELPLAEVARQHGVEHCCACGAAHFGGPVEVYRGFVLYRGQRFEDDTEVADGILLSGSVAVLRALLERGGAEFRLYLGYAGWGPGQLDLEITSGSWLTGECSARYLFELDPDQVWEQALADMGIDPVMVLQSSGDIQ
ncbi:MAG: YqgE/AlgH family protein [Deltaproteobacteria bacterium]|nr:YqgE/AlgH family protein [Deltaproteobacteria bacterium]